MSTSEPHSADLSRLAVAVFECLRLMDEEATTVRDGHQTGLSWYAGHSRPELQRPQTEPEWSQRLVALLTQKGFPAEAEVAYPDQPRQRCDVVVELAPGVRCWLELKGAWKAYWAESGGLWIYRSYLLHPLEPGLDAGRTHTVPLDLEKLARLEPGQASFVAELLVGFDAKGDPMDDDVLELIRLAGLHEAPWQTFTDAWADPRREGEHVKCWFWGRPGGPLGREAP